MKKIIQTLIIMVVGVMISISTVSAQPPGKMGECPMGPPGTMESPEQVADNILKELNLTAEQKNKLKANRRAQRDKMEDLQDELKAKHEELTNKLSEPNVSRADVEPITTALKSLQAKMMDCRLDGIFAVKEILTPEQFAKFQEKMKGKVENRKEAWKEQRGHHEK